MANEFKIGDITIILPDDLEIPEAAKSNISLEALREQGNPRRGVGLVCKIAADLQERYPGRLRLDPKFTPAYLRALGEAADAWDRVLLQIEEFKRLFQKANAATDNEAHEALSQLNKQLKAQLADDPALNDDFAAIRAYFGAKV
jgi:hypothetical protein